MHTIRRFHFVTINSNTETAAVDFPDVGGPYFLGGDEIDATARVKTVASKGHFVLRDDSYAYRLFSYDADAFENVVRDAACCGFNATYIEGQSHNTLDRIGYFAPKKKETGSISVHLSREEAQALIDSHMESTRPSLLASAAVSRIYEALDARRIDELEADALSIPTPEEIGERTVDRVRSLVSEMGRMHLEIAKTRRVS